MASIAQIRQQYPQYRDLSDKQLADALHARYYKQIPIGTFYERVGLSEAPTPNSDSLWNTALAGVQAGTGSLMQDVGALGEQYLGIGESLRGAGQRLEERSEASRSAADRAMQEAQAERERTATPGVVARAMGAIGGAYGEPTDAIARTVARQLPFAAGLGLTPGSGIGALIDTILPDTAEEAAVQGAKITAPFQSGRAAVDFAARQVPSTAASLIPGGLAARVGLRGAGPARVALATEAALNTASAGRQAADTVRERGGSEAEARSAYNKAVAVTLPVSVAATRMPSLEKQVFGPATGKGGLRGAASGAGRAVVAEAPQEFVQEAGAQAGVNVGTGDPLGEDVLSSGVLGAVAGATMGAPIGGVAGLRRTPTGEEIPVAEDMVAPVDEAAVAPEPEQAGEPAAVAESISTALTVPPAVVEPEPEVDDWMERTRAGEERYQRSIADLHRLGPDDLEALRLEAQASERADVQEALRLSGIVPSQRLARAIESGDPERAGNMLAAEIEKQNDGMLPPDIEKLLAPKWEDHPEGGLPNSSDIAELQQAYGDIDIDGDTDWNSYVAALGARRIDPDGIRRVLAGQGKIGDQAAFVRLREAGKALAKDGVPAADIPKRMVDALVQRGGWTPEQAAEIIGGFASDLSGMKDMAPKPTQTALPAPAQRALSAPMRDETPVPTLVEDVAVAAEQAGSAAVGTMPPWADPNLTPEQRRIAAIREDTKNMFDENAPDPFITEVMALVEPPMTRPWHDKVDALQAKYNYDPPPEVISEGTPVFNPDGTPSVAFRVAMGEDVAANDDSAPAAPTRTAADIQAEMDALPPGASRFTMGEQTPYQLRWRELRAEQRALEGTETVAPTPVEEQGSTVPPTPPGGQPPVPPAGGGDAPVPPSGRPQRALAARLKPTMDKIGASFGFRYRGAAQGNDIPLANALGITPEELSNEQSLVKSLELLDASSAGRLKQLDRKYFDPIIAAMDRLKADPQDVGMFLLARAAPDRNKRLAAETNGLVTDGAGISDAEAREVLAELDRQGKIPALREVAALFDKLTAHTRSEMVRGGLITRDEANRLARTEPYYAPLKGWATDGDMQISPDDAPGSGQRPARNGVPVKAFVQARGRESLPFNPLFNALADAQNATQSAQRNLAMQPLINGITSDPEAYAGVASVYTKEAPDLEWTGERDPETGEKIMRPVNMAGNPAYKIVKRDGRPYFIKPDMSTDAGRALDEAFGDMSPPQLNWFLKSVGALVGLMKSLRTRFSPGYLLGTAPFRDIADALVTAAAEEKMPGGAAYGKKLASRVAHYMRPGIRVAGRTLVEGSGTYAAIRTYLRGGEPTSAAEAEAMLYLEQMTEDGGTVGHAMIRDAEDAAQSAIKSLERMRKVQERNPLALTAEGGKWIAQALDDMSQAIDLQPRLATYRAALDEGLSREDAARLALNSSLNLTKRMRGGREMEMIWPFINAGVASIAKNLHLLRSPAYRKALVMMAGVGSAITAMNMMLGGGGDDDGDGQTNYQDIPESEKVGNLIVYYGMGGDDYIKLPMGFMVGFPVFMSQKLTEMAAGIGSPGQGATDIASGIMDIAKGFVGSYSPVRGDDATVLIPALLQAPVELIANKDYWGKPIWTKPNDPYKALSSAGRETTGDAYKWWAQAVNRLTDGEGEVAGGFDRAPEWYRHIVMTFAGGAGNFVRQVVGFAQEPEVKNIPVVRSKLSRSGEFAAMNKYYAAADRMNPIAQAETNADAGEWARLEAKFPKETDPVLIDAYRSARTQLQMLGKEKKAALDGLEGDERKAVIEEFKALRDEIYVDFNRQYNETPTP